MIDGLKPYPAMKDSDVVSLGEVPDHWDVKRLKRICRLAYGDALATEARQSGVVPVYGSNGRVGFHSAANTKAPCIVVGRKGSFGKVNFSSQPVFAIDTTFFVDGRFTTAVVRWLYLLLGWLRLDEVSKDSAVPGLDREDAYKKVAAVPPPAEQTAIVRFLDHADRRIRRYIRAKQKLIKLLEEQKQAIIHRAVTRGLDPNVRLKPSGVEWLGNVPEHWEVARLGRLIELVTGFPFKSDGFTQDPENIRLLRGVNISPGKIRWADVVRWPLSERDKYSAFELQVGDIVLGMDRPLIQSGTRVAIVTEADVPALLLQRVACIRPRDALQSEFLALLLAGKSFADYLTPIFTGISVPHLSPEQIKSFCFALPTDNEQREIVRWTAEKTRKTDVTISNADREIQLLREYRTRLIADVVTGKFDVREAAARLPQETEDLEPLDEAEVEREAEENEAGDGDGVPEETEA